MSGKNVYTKFIKEINTLPNANFYKLAMILAITMLIVQLFFSIFKKREPSLNLINFKQEMEFRLLSGAGNWLTRNFNVMIDEVADNTSLKDSDKVSVVERYLEYLEIIYTQKKYIANEIDLNLEDRIEILQKKIKDQSVNSYDINSKEYSEENVKENSLAVKKRKALKQQLVKLKKMRPLIILLTDPQKYPFITDLSEGIEDRKIILQLSAIVAANTGLVNIKSPTNLIQNKINKLKSRISLEHKVVSQVITSEEKNAWKNLMQYLLPLKMPLEKRQTKEKEFTKFINNSNLSSWFKQYLLFSMSSWLIDLNHAEQTYAFSEKSDTYITFMFFGNASVITILLFGFIWLIGFRIKVAPVLPMIQPPFSPGWITGFAHFSMFIIFYMLASVLFGGLTFLPVGKSIKLFVFSFLTYLIAVSVIFYPLFKKHGINLKTYIIKTDFILQHQSVRKLIKWIIGSFICAYVLVQITGVIINLGGNEGDTDKIRFISGMLNTSEDFIFIFITICILAPFFEELAFRGYLLSFFTERMSLWKSVLLNGFLFSFFHFEPANILPLMVLGCVLAYVRLKSGSLLVPMFVHLLWNLQTFLVIIISKL